VCGIFGFVSSREHFTDRIDSDAALRALAHRGPDGSAQLRTHAAGVTCGLVHTRLAIIDLSPSGEQPMWSSGGRYAIVYNGEIYNYRQVRDELARDGAQLRSASDTEAILEGYARWGEGVLGRLRGMFAFAIWDGLLGTLFLARDPLGVKPLYVASVPGGIAFASEVRALVASNAVVPRLCARAVQSYLSWGSVAEPDTILEGVRSLPPASHLTHKAGVSVVHQYWRPQPWPTSETSFEQAASELAPLLKEAIELQLVADVPVGVFLSGGIDSSVIAAIASQQSARPLDTFTVAFDEAAMSEGQHAAAVAAFFGCNHHQVLLRADRARDEIDDALAALDQPSADGINTYFVSKAVKAAGISVALSGLGGDEVFGGYAHFRDFATASRLAGKVPGPVGRGMEAVLGAPGLPVLSIRARKLANLLGGPPGAMGAYAGLRCMFTPSQVGALLSRELSSALPHSTSHPSVATNGGRLSDDPVNALSVLELSNYLRNTLLRDADVMSMAHALEVRVPLLDHRLIDALLPIPGSLKLHRSCNKPLLLAASPPLPPSAVNRPKMGFTLPFDAWLRGPLKNRVDSLFEDGAIPRTGLLDARSVQNIWQSFLAGDRRVNFSRVWSLVALLSWADLAKVGL